MRELSCATCGEPLPGPPSKWPYFPFCSRRCKLIDLGRWLDGRNNLPVMEPENEAFDPPLEEREPDAS